MNINSVFCNTKFIPEKLVQELKKDALFKQYYETQIRHYTIERHTLLVMKQYEKYFLTKEISINQNLFRLLLALHDIGKAQNRQNQHILTQNIIDKYQSYFPFSIHEISLVKLLISEDVLGSYLQNRLSLISAKSKITLLSNQSKLSQVDFFEILTVYYQCDVGSYTQDAGGLRFLEHLFMYENGFKIYDKTKKRLLFSNNLEQKYTALQNLLRDE